MRGLLDRSVPWMLSYLVRASPQGLALVGNCKSSVIAAGVGDRGDDPALAGEGRDMF